MCVSKKPQFKLNHTELVKHCASDLKNKNAWLEFRSRFEQHIYNQVIQECKNLELYRIFVELEETIKDLVQDVYLKLLENDCRALRKFRGISENSIYSYLGVIARSVVKNHFIKAKALKRPQIDKSLDDVNLLSVANEETLHNNGNTPSFFSTEPEFTIDMLKEEIDYYLVKTLKGKKKMRDKFIYQLHLYGLSSGEIALLFNFHISTKRIANIISDSKKKLIETLSLAKQHETLAC